MRTWLLLLYTLAAPSFLLAGTTWESADGKQIQAEFIRLTSDQNVVLLMSGKEFKVPLQNLSEKSQLFAQVMHKGMMEWARTNISSPILTEEILIGIHELDPSLVEGRTFLVEGRIARFNVRTLAKSPSDAIEVELNGGTRTQVSLADQVDGRRTRAEVKDNQVILLKAQTLSGGDWKNFQPAGAIMQVGDPIHVRVTGVRGRLEGQGKASSQEVTSAQLKAAAANGGLSLDQLVQLEQLRIRIAYLEAQLGSGEAGSGTLSGDRGYIGTITFKYSDAEMAAMQKELELLKGQLAAAAK